MSKIYVLHEYQRDVGDFVITQIHADMVAAGLAKATSTAESCSLQALDGDVVIRLLEQQGKSKLRSDIELLVVEKTAAEQKPESKE